MIDHNLPSLNLLETLEGEMIIPSEQGNLSLRSNLRQFIVQLNRNYTATALNNLKNIQDIQLFIHSNISPEDVPPFFCVDIVIKPEETLEEFSNSEKAEELVEQIILLASNSKVRKFSGQRAVFISNFGTQKIPDVGDVITTKLLISTSIFYNDYRVTSNFPSTEEEHTKVTENIFNSLIQQFPDIDFEVNYSKLNLSYDPLNPSDNDFVFN